MSTTYNATSHTLPMAVSVPDKLIEPYLYRDNYSISPPDDAGSETSASAVPSFSSGTHLSGSASNYAGSTSGEYDSSASANGLDFQEYMQDRFTIAFDPIPLDRAVAVQAQT